MAPYLKHIQSTRSDLISQLESKNTSHIESLDAKIKEAEEQEGDTEIADLFRQKAMYYCRIGDKVGLISLYTDGSNLLGNL
jgi:26S proteasome regulatory subunit N7